MFPVRCMAIYDKNYYFHCFTNWTSLNRKLKLARSPLYVMPGNAATVRQKENEAYPAFFYKMHPFWIKSEDQGTSFTAWITDISLAT